MKIARYGNYALNSNLEIGICFTDGQVPGWLRREVVVNFAEGTDIEEFGEEDAEKVKLDHGCLVGVAGDANEIRSISTEHFFERAGRGRFEAEVDHTDLVIRSRCRGKVT